MFVCFCEASLMAAHLFSIFIIFILFYLYNKGRSFVDVCLFVCPFEASPMATHLFCNLRK